MNLRDPSWKIGRICGSMLYDLWPFRVKLKAGGLLSKDSQKIPMFIWFSCANNCSQTIVHWDVFPYFPEMEGHVAVETAVPGKSMVSFGPLVKPPVCWFNPHILMVKYPHFDGWTFILLEVFSLDPAAAEVGQLRRCGRYYPSMAGDTKPRAPWLRHLHLLVLHMGLSENSVPLHPMVNDHYPY